MNTSKKLVHCANNSLEHRVDIFRNDIDSYVSGNLKGLPFCPHANKRDVLVYVGKEKKTIEYVKKPGLCDCNQVRIDCGIKVANCRTYSGCPIRVILFPEGNYS